MKAAIIIFPGTNREQDMQYALSLAGFQTEFIFCRAEKLPENIDLAVLPGGFSFGDYLRTGAMSANTPIMDDIKNFAAKGGLVLGICNGFQILCEAGLLPGILMRNKDGRFICKTTRLVVENSANSFMQDYHDGEIIRIPIAHGEGNYFADEVTLARLERHNRILLRYVRNPNGSQNDIAGILNDKGNVAGMMPHPENHVDLFQYNMHGLKLFKSIFRHGAFIA